MSQQLILWRTGEIFDFQCNPRKFKNPILKFMGSSINEVRFFLIFFDPLPPCVTSVMDDPYLMRSNPISWNTTLRLDCLLWKCSGAILTYFCTQICALRSNFIKFCILLIRHCKILNKCFYYSQLHHNGGTNSRKTSPERLPKYLYHAVWSCVCKCAWRNAKIFWQCLRYAKLQLWKQ